MTVATTPISARERELLAMPTVASQLPITFANGASWNEFIGHCKFCKREIPDGLLVGAVTRPLQSVVVIESIGVCPECRMATPFLYRLHDDMRLTGPRNGRWVEWRPTATLAERIRGRTRRLFRLIKEIVCRMGK